MDKKCFMRIVSGALAASMTFTLVPAGAFAASPTENPVPPPRTVLLEAENSGESAVTADVTYDSLGTHAAEILAGTYNGNIEETSWSYYDGMLTIESGGIADFTGYTVSCEVANYGRLEGGTFSGSIQNVGVIAGGTFTSESKLLNCGEITGDAHFQEDVVVYNVTISGNPEEENSQDAVGTITGGTFANEINNGGTIGEGFGNLSGTDFLGGTVTGGVFSTSNFELLRDLSCVWIEILHSEARINDVIGKDGNGNVTAYALGNVDVTIKKPEGKWLAYGINLSAEELSKAELTFNMKDVVADEDGDKHIELYPEQKLEFNAKGVPTSSGGRINGWEYTETGRLQLYENFGVFDYPGQEINCFVINIGAEIKDGIFNVPVDNYDTISGGTFRTSVRNDGTVSGGIFEAEYAPYDDEDDAGDTKETTFTNAGLVTDGTFKGKVENEDEGTITGGTFEGEVENEGTITGDAKFTETSNVTNGEDGIISGGTFAGTGDISTAGTITGGVFLSGNGLYMSRLDESKYAFSNFIVEGKDSLINDLIPAGKYVYVVYPIDKDAENPAIVTVTSTSTKRFKWLTDRVEIIGENTSAQPVKVKITEGFGRIAPDEALEFDANGIPTGIGNNLVGWNYGPLFIGATESTLQFDRDYVFDQDMIVNCPVWNEGTIKNGTFNEEVTNVNSDYNTSQGKIEGGTFNGEVINGTLVVDKGEAVERQDAEGQDGECSIKNGIFTGNVINRGIITDGTFAGEVENNGTISGGVFAKGVSGEITKSERNLDIKDSNIVVNGVITTDDLLNGNKLTVIGDSELTFEYTGKETVEKWMFGFAETDIRDAENNKLTFKCSEIKIDPLEDGSWYQLVTPLFALRVENGKPTSKGNFDVLGWEYDGDKLMFDESYIFDQDVTVSCDVLNYGEIAGGKFTGTVTNGVELHDDIDGENGDRRSRTVQEYTISGGAFEGKVVNHGTITGGSFAEVENHATIADGSFTGEVKNVGMGEITGGDFEGKVENNGKPIAGGTFAEVPTGTTSTENLATLTVPTDCTIDGTARTSITVVKGTKAVVQYTGSLTSWKWGGLDGEETKENPLTILLGENLTLTVEEVKQTPSQPEQPSEPEKPDTGDTENPGEPENPEKPSQPETPSNPDDSKPGTDKPGETPSEPEKPEESDKSDSSTETPEQPEKPDTGNTEKPGTDDTEKPGTDKPDTGDTDKPNTDKPDSGNTDKPNTDKPAEEPSEPQQPAQDDSGAGALIVGGVLVAGGVATGVLVYKLAVEYIQAGLPEGAAIPETREQLAVALWQKASRPEVVVEEGVTLTDTEKAMRWAIENQLISAEGEDSVDKFDVLVAVYKAKKL